MSFTTARDSRHRWVLVPTARRTKGLRRLLGLRLAKVFLQNDRAKGYVILHCQRLGGETFRILVGGGMKFLAFG